MAKNRGVGQYFEMSFLTSDLILKNMFFAIFLGFLAMVYIANAHYAERNVRKIQELRRELKEDSWYKDNLKAENATNSQRSEIIKQVKDLGLIVPEERPKKIIIKE